MKYPFIFIDRIIFLLSAENKIELVKRHFKWIYNKYFHNRDVISERPIILISACENKEQTGDFKYNGGIKFYNMCVKLLRSKGFLAYVVTYDGKYQSWMIDHQPHISLQVVREWKKAGKTLRFFTTWLAASAFNNLADKIYFHDAELAYSFGVHLPLLSEFIESDRIVLSTETRAEQSYYRALLHLDTHLIPPYLDPDYFFPNPSLRIKNRIGYVTEDLGTETQINKISKIKNALKKNNIKAEFILAKGMESEFNLQLQSCDFFIGLNPGKDKFHSEGLARMHLEAMGLGAVVLAFDVGGNREFIFDNVTGRLIEQGNLNKLIESLVYLIRNPSKKEELRKNALWVCTHLFTKERTWLELKHFLDLDNFADIETHLIKSSIILNKQELELLLDAPVYLAEEEVPLFRKYIPLASETIVEIGAAYGASALLSLLSKQPPAKVYSIDAFTMDEKTKPPLGAPTPPSYDACINNVRNGLTAVGLAALLNQWRLIKGYSHDVAETWQKKIDFIFIDGDHSYEGVKQDFDDWFPKVSKGGIIFLHDSRLLPGSLKDQFNRGWDGSTKLSGELKKRKDIKLIDQAYSMTVWQKT